MIELIKDIKIISKAKKQNECIIKECKIKFEPSIDLSSVYNNKSDIINIELEDNFSITLYEITMDEIKVKYSNIDNKRPYIFDFYTLINNEFLFHCIIEDLYINHVNDRLNKETKKIYLKTMIGSKLILEKVSNNK